MEGTDDWMLDSLQKYESLYMYEMHHPTKCLDWTKEGSAICVAGFSSEQNNDILQLSIPEKLLPREKQTLCARRDFKMINGGLTDAPVTGLKSLEPSNFLLASCGSSFVIDLWTEDPLESDMLKKADEIHLNLPGTLEPHTPQKASPNHATLLDHTPDSPTSLLAGSTHYSLASVQLVDIDTKQILFQVDGDLTPSDGRHSNNKETTPLHGLYFVSGSGGRVFVTCSGEEGIVKLWDIRETVKEEKISDEEKEPNASNSHTAMAPCSQQQTYAMALSRLCSPSDTKVTILSSSGQLRMYDSRKMEVPLFKFCVKGENELTAVFRSRFAVERSERLCLQFSPSYKSLLSVSGLSKGIQVYDTSNWTDGMTKAPAPLFTHKGHEEESPSARVLVHSWQEGVAQNTIFSADSEGSLHAWEWKQ